MKNHLAPLLCAALLLAIVPVACAGSQSPHTDWLKDAKPGVVSLQGHDPTTDLSFRNLRIGELPAEKH
jgi:hypothetical protein